MEKIRELGCREAASASSQALNFSRNMEAGWSSTTGNAGQNLLVLTMDSLHPEMWKRNREFDFNSNLKPLLERLPPTAKCVQALL